MNNQTKTPAANGGGNQNFRPTGYATAFRPAISDWLNPRRRKNAEAVLAYIAWHGRKVFFTSEVYDDLRHENRLDCYAVDTAVDDLYTLGCVDISIAGETSVVKVLDTDIDRLAGLAGRERR